MPRKLLHIILFLGIFSNLNAQVYPVQAFVQLTPPYTGYLPDYADPFNEQMKILLTLNDFSVPSYTVKLKLSITGSGFAMQTKPFITLPAIELTPGVPVQISGSELAFYLSSANLDFTGISVAEYETKKVLPEGMYSICVQVLDFYNASNLVLANSSCASAWFTLQSPPLLNTPFCGTEINPTDPQMVLFNWSPLSMSWAGAITGTEYEFSLYEIRPAGANPNVVITTTVPIYTTTTSQTFISYGITEPALQVGMEYVWCIRAYDIGGRDAFLNNGYSQPCTFTYGNIAESIAGNIVLTLNANGTGSRQGLANWNASSVFDHYTLEVRKVGGATSTWFPYNATSGVLKVNDLEPLTQYEARVKGHTGEFVSDYSNVATFTTLALPDYSCNNTVVPPVETGVVPLQNLIIGNIVSTGQFEMIVTQVESSPAPGIFSGFGKVNVPFMLLNFNVHFENVFIDENMSLRTGRLVVLTQGIEAWAGEIFSNQPEPDYTYPGNLDSITLTGNTLVLFSNGDTIHINYPGGTFVIEDENGDQWTVYEDGTIVFTPSVPHIEISNDEKEIYKLALQKLEISYSADSLLNYSSTLNSATTNYKNVIEQETKISYSSIDTSLLKYVYGSQSMDVQEFTAITEEVELRNAEFRILHAKVCNAFAKIKLTTEELDLLANFLIVEGQKSYLYIREKVLSGMVVDDIAVAVKLSMVDFIGLVVDEKLKKNN